jgi:hypothetical protein
MSVTSNSTQPGENSNSTGGIYRINKQRNFSIMSNEPLTDERLSWEARGVLAYLLTKPDGWVVRNTDLIRRGPAGVKKIKRIIRELRESGYIHRERRQRQDGRFYWISEVYETPQLHRPQKGPRSIGPKSIDGSGDHLVTTDSLKTEVVHINDESNTERDEQADIQELGLIIKLDLGGNGDQARAARSLYFEHWAELSLREIAELAMSPADEAQLS